jgi:hypothetical protein
MTVASFLFSGVSHSFILGSETFSLENYLTLNISIKVEFA